MYQTWQDLLFLHWQYPAVDIQRRLPAGLTVDTFEGRAFVGVVPFKMRRIRPWWSPSVPGISNFLELNVRTYVCDEQGRPGVFFHSLDANQGLAVRIARWAFHLPYFYARMRVQDGDQTDYESHRVGSRETARFIYRRDSATRLAEPGSLEFFLVERYLLFTENRVGRRFAGRVQHVPYPVADVDLVASSDFPLQLAGYAAPQRPPDHALASPGVDVQVLGLVPRS